MAGKHESDGGRLRAALREGVTVRALALVLGVLAVQLGFIASYLGAFHQPGAHRIPVAVAAPGLPAGTATQAAAQLNALPGHPVQATAVPDEASARARVTGRTAYGAYLLSGSGKDQLLVASAAGASVAQALQTVFTDVAARRQHGLTVTDLVPAAAGDARGLSAFYLCVGWVVGGYLVASALSISRGARAPHAPAAVIRLGALALYSVASGVGGAAITEKLLGALTGHFLTLSGFGTLLVFAAGAFTMALQALTGIMGIGITVVLFVVLGNPSAGGAYPWPMLPTFWRLIGPWLPPGAGTSAVRGIVYFHDAGVGVPVRVLAGYALGGVLGTVLTAFVQGRRGAPRPPPEEPAATVADVPG